MQAIHSQIACLYDSRFQDFIDCLYATSYGPSFVPVLQKHDKGCDGLIPSTGTAISVYAPQNYTLGAFKRKAGDDFHKYEKNWASEYPNWQYLYNGEYTAEAQNYLRSLKADVTLMSRTHLAGLIDRLSWANKRRIASYLRIDEQYVIHNVLDEILDDLLTRSETEAESRRWESPVYVGDKIAINYSPSDLDTAMRQQEECMPYFGILQRLLAQLTPTDLASLKSRIANDYLGLDGDFAKRIFRLTQQYSEKYPGDDTYEFCSRVVLLFLFEQCIIGRRTATEQVC